MFLTTNNEVIWSLKSTPAMVFHRERTLRASASRLLLPFVSSNLGNKTTISYLSVLASCNSASGHPQPRGCIVLTVAQKGMK